MTQKGAKATAMKTYITEAWLRERYSMAEGTELHLPADSLLTPAARSLISDRHLRVRYIDEAGQVFVEAADGTRTSEAPAQKRVHPLTDAQRGHGMHCTLCRQAVEKKPDTLTHLNADTLVSKSDPRIRFRGSLDVAIAQAVWIQAELIDKGDAVPTALKQCLADVRSALGNVLRAEVTGEPLHPVHMGEFDAEAIHRLSHAPLKHLGHDHIVPEASHGLTVARLNLLRAAIRETEVSAAQIYISPDFEISRPDIMQGLNRLSSAVYVLMIAALMIERSMPIKEGTWN